MNLSQRIILLQKLGDYFKRNTPEWQAIKKKAYLQNPWFLPAFIDLAVNNIADQFLQVPILHEWVKKYPRIKDDNSWPKLVGIVMAGNIPLVGFHDFLCVFITGNKCLIKPSSKDEVLIKHIVHKLIEWEPQLDAFIRFETMLKNCDAYIATGSNSSAGYFEYYFGKYANLIRRNRTSVAILTGAETDEQLNALADDVYLYYGMGCRNVTKIYVPQDYNFEQLLNIFKKYDYLADEHKYKNNYDYNLALHILNNRYYMSNASIILVEDKSIFSAISQLHYEFYNDGMRVPGTIKDNDVQCIVGKDYIPFGKAQCPRIDGYADGEDTMQFLTGLV